MLRKCTSAVVIALCLMVWSAIAYGQANIVGSGIFDVKKPGGGVAFSITNTSKKADTSGLSTITYNSGGNPSIGATNGGNRIIVITVSGRNFISSPTCTVNGNAATRAGSRFGGSGGAALFYISDSAAGTSALTSAAVVVTYGGGQAASEIGVYVVTTSTPSQTPTEADNANFSASTSIAATVTIPASGGGIAVVGIDDNGTATTTTWTGMTPDYDDAVGAPDIQASGTHTTSTGSTTFTANFGSKPDNFLVATSWAP